MYFTAPPYVFFSRFSFGAWFRNDLPDYCFPDGKKRVTKRKKKSSTRVVKKQCTESTVVSETIAVVVVASESIGTPAETTVNEPVPVETLNQQQSTNTTENQSSPAPAITTASNGVTTPTTPTNEKTVIKPVSLPKEPIMNEIEAVNDYWGNPDASVMKKPIKVSLVSFTGKSESE